MKKIRLLLLLLSTCNFVFAQINADTSKTTEYLVKNILLGQGVVVGNIKYQGPQFAVGTFSDLSEQLGMQKGIILTSGNVFYAKGPNKSAWHGWASGGLGDSDLNRLTSGVTFDAAVLEFDFVTTSEYLAFDYVFGSEEYLEYVGSEYNDVFGFFIDGPGLDHVNLARIPNTEVPISINNVNHKKNKKYYINNEYKNNKDRFIWNERNNKVVENKYYRKRTKEAPYDLQYDGFTKLLRAECKVVPGQIYHIKLAIADVSDGILDSGVFLKAGSFHSHGEKVVKINDPFHTPDKIPSLPIVSTKPTIENPIEKMIDQFKEDTISISQVSRMVWFEFDSYELKHEQEASLKEVFKYFRSTHDHVLMINGHTCSIGSKQYNMNLSKLRTQAILDRLISLGVDKDLVETNFFGEEQPYRSNQTEEGRAKNRRVEVILQSQINYPTEISQNTHEHHIKQ